MKFFVNNHLLASTRATLSQHRNLYWFLGGAGAGKTTVCRLLAEQTGLPVYDMDAHIYGSYHGRFTTRHPVNRAWAAAPHGLAWLLSMSWEEFDAFNQAALPEYLDLLADDLAQPEYARGVLVDGGICNPALLSQAIPVAQIVCLAAPEQSSTQIWETGGERGEMKLFINQLPHPDEMWRKFLEFDARITKTIGQESQACGIPVCIRRSEESVEAFAHCVSQTVGIAARSS
jgi:hypothetical protein